MLKSDNEQVIEKEIIGKTIEGITINEGSVVIKLSDGNFLDVDLNKNGELIARLNWY